MSKEIVICEECCGRGFLIKSVLEDYHRGIYTEKNVPCNTCKESGRLIKITTIVIRPYESDVD